MTTLCYIEYNGCYLMLRRDRKEHDLNEGKWIGTGGHFLPGESPDECLVREVREETGFSLSGLRFRGIVTFRYGDVTEYMHLFTAAPDLSTGAPVAQSSADAGMPQGCAGLSTQERSSEVPDRGIPMPPLPACSEGTLAWIPKEEVPSLPVWKGDRIFLRLLAEDTPCFLLTLEYDEDGALSRAVLDGTILPLPSAG